MRLILYVSLLVPVMASAGQAPSSLDAKEIGLPMAIHGQDPDPLRGHLGTWRRNGIEIEVARSGNGQTYATGRLSNGRYGGHFYGVISKDDRVTDGACTVELDLYGPDLRVIDNGACAALDGSFSGTYGREFSTAKK